MGAGLKALSAIAIVGLSASPLWADSGIAAFDARAGTQKDLCSYLKDIESKTDNDCVPEALISLESRDRSAYAQKIELARKRKIEVQRAYDYLKDVASADAAKDAKRIELSPPISDRTFPAWFGPDAKDLKAVYAHWLQIQNVKLERERSGSLPPERKQQIDAQLAQNRNKLARLEPISDSAKLSCYIGESCGTRSSVSDPEIVDAGNRRSWTLQDFSKANEQENSKSLVPGGNLDRAVPALEGVASEVVANSPLAPLSGQPADQGRSPAQTAGELALVTAGGLLLFGGLGGKQLEERLPGIRRNMGVAALIGGALATTGIAWPRLAGLAPLAANPTVQEQDRDAVSSGQTVLQRVIQPASNVVPQASVGVQETAVLEREMVQEFSSLRTMGREGSSSRIRILDGTVQDAQALFQRLSRFGKPLSGTSYPGTLVELPNGARVGLRLTSTSGPPTIDVHTFPGVAQYLEIKFIK